MYRRVSRLLSSLTLILALPLAAQGSEAPWRLSYFPYFTVSPNDGLMGMARAIWFQQAEWGDRVTLNNSVAVEAGYSTKGSWLARATWANPRLAPDWRIKAHAEVGHQPRFGDPDAGVERDHAKAWVDVTRHVEGPLHLALRGGTRREQFGEVDNSRFETDFTLRGAVVADLRDREFEVNRGALLEGGVIFGTGGREGYRALYTDLRGWYNPLPYLRFTGRFAWREAITGGSYASTFEIPSWEGDFIAVGGQKSHRGMGIGELSGYGSALAGAEVRFDLLNFGEMGAFSVMAFVDGGRLNKPESVLQLCEPVCPEQPEYDWHWAPGGGIALRVLRAATLTVSAARMDGNTTWYVGSGWSW